MERRHFLKLLTASVPLFTCGCSNLWHQHHSHTEDSHSHNHIDDLAEINAQGEIVKKDVPHGAEEKVINFDQDFADDIFCDARQFNMIQQLVLKFRAVQRRVGHGNFNLLGMDEFFIHSQHTLLTPAVTSDEKLFLEELFFFDAKKYGFLGDKNFTQFTDVIKKSTVEKIPYSGHFLRKGKSLETYNQIKKDVGSTVILTSGVRSLAKQFHLFLEKTLLTKGNLSRASRSLAPPGYSFHGKGDFDIGRFDYGLKNFTDDFAKTSEFKNLQRLGYVEIRYTELNRLGVRFEPWHIKIS